MATRCTKSMLGTGKISLQISKRNVSRPFIVYINVSP